MMIAILILAGWIVTGALAILAISLFWEEVTLGCIVVFIFVGPIGLLAVLLSEIDWDRVVIKKKEKEE